MTILLNQKVVITGGNFFSLVIDCVQGNIIHDPATAAGRQITINVEADGLNTITLASVAKGDLDGNGTINGDDLTLAIATHVAVADGFAVLDTSGAIGTVIRS